MTDSRQDLLVEYVATAMEHIERGEPVDLESICREHPELVPAVAAAVAQSRALPKMLGQSDRQSGARMLTPRYRLDERVGAGAMGVVYRATDLDLRRTVAIKLLRSDLFDEPTAAARFAREAEALAALDHPNIVAVFDRGTTEDGTAFLVMEFIAGQSLTRLLAERNTRSTRGNASDLAAWVRQSVQWTVELAQALHVAHEKGILHRDIKPSNILVDGHGRARLLDFGIAAQSGQATLTATRDGTLGTPAYMAPEQLAERVRPAPTADVYSLTATLYHLLTGRPPYLGTASQVLARMQRSDPTPLQKLRPGTPRDLIAVVDKGMARTPAHRYASMADLAADLQSLLEYRAVQARPVTAASRLIRQARRSTAARAAAIAAVLLLGVQTTLSVRQWRDDARRDRAAAAESALPPSQGIETAKARTIADANVRRAVSHLLDTLVSDSRDPTPRLCQRAAFHYDHGNLQAAADDAERLAQITQTPIARELARRYAASARDPSTTPPFTSPLPEPTSPSDYFLLAHHLLRAGTTATNFRLIIQHLGEAADLPIPALELLTLAHISESERLRKSDGESSDRHRESAARLVATTEALRGHRTATTAYQQGTICLASRKYAEAATHLEAAHALCADSPQVLVNLAIALRHRRSPGDATRAEAYCRQAITARPSNWRPRITLSRIQWDAGAVDAARLTLRELPTSKEANEAAALREVATLELLIALKHYAADQMDDARTSAAEAHRWFLAAGMVDTVSARASHAIATGSADMFSILLELAKDQPASQSTLLSIARRLPGSMSERELALLRDYLARVAHALDELD